MRPTSRTILAAACSARLRRCGESQMLPTHAPPRYTGRTHQVMRFTVREQGGAP